MRIGLNGGAATVDRMVEQAVRTEAEGFTSLWYPSAVAGDPLVAMALAGRATTTLELGTAVLQTYTSHPALMANRVLAAASDGAQRIHARYRPVARSRDRGVVRYLLQQRRPSHRGVRHGSSRSCSTAKRSSSSATTSRSASPHRDRRRRHPCRCSSPPSAPRCCGSRVQSATARSSGWPTRRPSRRT